MIYREIEPPPEYERLFLVRYGRVNVYNFIKMVNRYVPNVNTLISELRGGAGKVLGAR